VPLTRWLWVSMVAAILPCQTGAHLTLNHSSPEPPSTPPLHQEDQSRESSEVQQRLQQVGISSGQSSLPVI
jgi:hypothetical protein